MSAAAGCGCTCAVAWMVGRSPDASVGWRYVCFNHSVVRCHVLTCAVPSLLFSTSPYYSHLPPLHAVLLFVYRNEPCVAAFYDRLACTESSGIGLQPLRHKPDDAD